MLTEYRTELPLDTTSRSLNCWQETVHKAILVHGQFAAELRAVSEDVFADKFPTIEVEGNLTLVWRDATFHNTVVQADSSEADIDGIFDLESASYGNCKFDLHHVEADFWRREPEDVYRNPMHIDAFHQGYKRAGGSICSLSQTDALLFEVIFCVRGLRWWWDNLGILHRSTSHLMERLQAALRGIVAL